MNHPFKINRGHGGLMGMARYIVELTRAVRRRLVRVAPDPVRVRIGR